ncbi:MAG: ankyrin repeat domain-containing protein [Candidatus Berkiella sp.]
MLGNNEQLLQRLIDCLDPGEQTAENAARLEGQAAAIIQTHPKLLAMHSKEDENVTPLIASVMSSKYCCTPDLFAKLLNKPTQVDAVKDYNISAIHFIARYNRFEHLQLLLKLKPDVDAQNDDGDTPLIFAALTGATQTLTLLAVLGKAKVNLVNHKKQSPLHIACSFGQRQGGKDQRPTPITEKETRNYLECIETLLISGANVNARDENDATPVHYLVSADIPDEIKLQALTSLLEYGADLTLRANNNFSAADMVKAYQYDHFSDQLKKHIVPSLKVLSAKKLLDVEEHNNEPVSLFEDLANLLSKIRLGRGKKD